jgi:hypothetical protein
MRLETHNQRYNQNQAKFFCFQVEEKLQIRTKEQGLDKILRREKESVQNENKTSGMNSSYSLSIVQ